MVGLGDGTGAWRPGGDRGDTEQCGDGVCWVTVVSYFPRAPCLLRVPLLEGLYDQNLRGPIINGTSPDGEEAMRLDKARIPKIIHQVWLGGDELPDQFELWRQSWLDRHPDWKHVLWTEEEIEELPFLRRELYDSAPNLGAKSDAVRLEVIWRFGGLYVDTDFECLHSFDELHARLDFFAAISNVGALEISNGLLAARKRHPLVRRAILDPESSLLPAGAAAQLDWIGV